MQVHITMEPAGRNIVPVQRWLYLETEDIKAHCNKFGVVTWGCRQQMAERLQMRHVQYNDVLHARHLRKMLEQEGTPDTTSERKLLVNKLMLKPVPAPGDLPVPAPRRPPPPRAGPATAAAAAPAPDNVLPPVAAAAKAPKQWKIELVKKHRALCAQGSKLTKERCALWLENWGKLEEGDAVYHIISPAAGGKDHPHNYCVLPGYFPADYHLSEEKADLHHMLMLELLGETQVRTALRAGLEGEADGVTEAEDRLNEIKAMFKKLKANANDASNPGFVSRQLNQQITQASSLQKLTRVLVVNFGRMNAVNFCTAYHRLAKFVEDARRQRQPPEAWPPAQQQQLGQLLGQLNAALLGRLEEAQAHNLGLTLWAISKTCQLPRSGVEELVGAMHASIVHRMAAVTRDTYMRDKHYCFGAQALSNIIYSAATMGLRPDYELLHAVAKAVAWQIEEFKPQGLANIVWGLGKMGVKVTHEVRQMVEVLGREMAAQLTHARHKGSLAPQNISNMLHGFTNLGMAPAPELLSALAHGADEMLRQFGPQELTNTVWSLSQMHRNGVPFPPDVDALLDRIPDEVLLLWGDRSWRARVRPQTISNLALAYAHLHRAPQMLISELVNEALPLLPQFKPQELSNLMWAMATMAFYPGTSTVDVISRAAAAAASSMKPQELANTAWAWATLRHFPGAQLLDAVLGCAEAQLERFKCQEVGMLSWSVAKLGYMPAAALVRHALPYITSAPAPAVQDCGNVLWAFTVLDILTPEVMARISERMLSLPPECFTQENYIQLYQAKMSLSQQVFDIAQYIPPELLAQAETEWRRQSGDNKISATHRDVAAVMRELSLDFEVEKKIEDGLMSVDIALRGEMVAVEVDGSAHFTINEPFVPLGRTLWRWRLLASRGWRVVTVPYFRWAMLGSLAQKKQYLYQLLQCHNVWDCFTLDPSNRDAPPFCPPANLAHLTPDEAFQLAADGVPPSSLLEGPSHAPSSCYATPVASPATPLLASGPATGSSTGSVSGLGPAVLRPPSAAGSGGALAGLLPQPLPLAGLGGSRASPPAAAADSGGYGRLPDCLYANESPLASPLASGSGRFGLMGSGGGGGGSGGLNVSARPFSFGGGGGGGGRHSAGTAGGLAPSYSSTSGGPAYLTGSNRTGSGGSGGFGGVRSSSGTWGPPAAASFDRPASPALPRAAGLTGSSGSTSSASSLPGSNAASPAPPPFGGLHSGSTQAGFHSPGAVSMQGAPTAPRLGTPTAAGLPGLGQSPALRAVTGLQSTPPASRLGTPVVTGLSGSGRSPAPGTVGGLSSASRSQSPALGAVAGLGVAALSGGGSEAIGVGLAGGLGPPRFVAPIGLDGDSDDDVSDLRSYFGSVIGLSPAVGLQGPLSVEEVRLKLALLPEGSALDDHAPAWLAGWEEAQVVELLTQLDTPTTAARAVQLFDWLRALPVDSPLAPLCTPATYATMIGLYGRWRKPKPAVRLFAELKERGEDGPEVHSALVEAFCRSGQGDVALDAFANMLAQGLAPTPAAARAVLDLHVERGAWEAADALLVGLVEAVEAVGGGEAGNYAELFETAIERACAAGTPAAAQSAFDHMCHAGVPPSAATFAALLGALRCQLPPAEAAEAALALSEQADAAAAAAGAGATPGRALAEAHAACASRGWFDLSLELLAATEAAGGAPTLEAVNAALVACAAGGAVAEARCAFDRLAAHGLQPSAASYHSLVAAHCAAGDWAAAAREYDSALDAGVVPSEGLVSLVVDALWGTGLPWAQAAARAAFDRAVGAGWLPPPRATVQRSLLKLDLAVQHLGTGMLCMHRWLHDMRAAIGNRSEGASPCLLSDTKRVCVFSSAIDAAHVAHGAAAPPVPAAAPPRQLAAALKDALGACLVLHKAPFRVTYEAGVATRLESSNFMLKKWLFTDSFDEWDRAVTGRSRGQPRAAAAAAGEAHASVDLPELAMERDVVVRQESEQAFALIREYEAGHPPTPHAPGLAPGAGYVGQRRRELAEAARHLVTGLLPLGATMQLWHAAVVLLDRCAAAGYTPCLGALLAAACVGLAAEREGLALDPAALAGQLDASLVRQVAGAEPEVAVAAEMAAVAAALHGDTECLSAVHAWKVLASRLEVRLEDEAEAAALLGSSLARLHELLWGDAFWLAHPPSIQAAAALCAARRERGLAPFWPSVLATLTGYEQDTHQQFTEALRALQRTAQYGSTVTQARLEPGSCQAASFVVPGHLNFSYELQQDVVYDGRAGANPVDVGHVCGPSALQRAWVFLENTCTEPVAVNMRLFIRPNDTLEAGTCITPTPTVVTRTRMPLWGRVLLGASLTVFCLAFLAFTLWYWWVPCVALGRRGPPQVAAVGKQQPSLYAAYEYVPGAYHQPDPAPYASPHYATFAEGALAGSAPARGGQQPLAQQAQQRQAPRAPPPLVTVVVGAPVSGAGSKPW
ncbi:Tbc2 translation chloroplastic isoform B [Micractinium conductrix]|uniref:Tbc2 translation chloroplastic isoform B n=1 Tax=Micractinium conductrix TaxID=554055 RepID=A0A2P6VA88_9CHLO|nr:Tbc2 translation chloroplastic isoform B [Micractinium conductrix]|eukprot:PSC71010.1 Tbc2 translation chloroplastic isoform B [Micractinium conductrix]